MERGKDPQWRRNHSADDRAKDPSIVVQSPATPGEAACSPSPAPSLFPRSLPSSRCPSWAPECIPLTFPGCNPSSCSDHCGWVKGDDDDGDGVDNGDDDPINDDGGDDDDDDDDDDVGNGDDN